jgi:hypothetical protein
MMRGQTMSPRHIHYPGAGLKALGYDPAFHIVRPAPISTRPLHNLNAAIKPVPAIRHHHLLLNAQNETDRWISVLEPKKSMGRKRRIRRFPASFDKETYKWWHLIENYFGKLKENRGIAMRSCKTDQSFAAFISLAATIIQLR